MDLNLLVEVLKLIVPSSIALISLIYAIKQRNLVKEGISKKRYLESALSNLNEATKCLEEIPTNFTLTEDSDELAEATFLAFEILTASFELKRKSISLEVSYYLEDLGERNKPYDKREKREIHDFENYSPQLLIDFIGKGKNRTLLLESDARIVGFNRIYSNNVEIKPLLWSIEWLLKAKDTLSSYQVVYENFSPNSIKKLNLLIEEIAEEVLETIRKPKHIEVDLNKLTHMNEIIKYLVDKIGNYSNVAMKISKVSEVISELTEIRKELYSKIT